MKEKVGGRCRERERVLQRLAKKRPWEVSRAWRKVSGKVSEIKEETVDGSGNMVDKTKEKAGDIKDNVVDGFENAKEYITSLPGQAKEWGKDFIKGHVDGIKENESKCKERRKGCGQYDRIPTCIFPCRMRDRSPVHQNGCRI